MYGSLFLTTLFLVWGLFFYKNFLRYKMRYGQQETITRIIQIISVRQCLTYGFDRCTALENFPLYILVAFGKILVFGSFLRCILLFDLWAIGSTMVISMCLALIIRSFYLKVRTPGNVNWRVIYSLPSDFGLLELTLQPEAIGSAWIGATLAELDLRKKDLLVLSILRHGKLITFPKGPEILHQGDRLLVYGKYPLIFSWPLQE